MEVINPNGVKVYDLSAGKSFPKVGRLIANSRCSFFLRLNEEIWRRMTVLRKVERRDA